MKRGVGGMLLALVLVALPAGARAYVRSTASTGDATPIAWDLTNSGTVLTNVAAGEVTFRVHGSGSADVADGSDLTAVARAFRTWAGVSGSSMAFTRGADTNTATTLFDEEFPVFWTESSTTITQDTPQPGDDVNIAGALAVTFTYRYTSGSEAGEIVDANIVFNGNQYQWTTDPAAFPDRFDIESVALHEIGHALGLDHSPVAAATMFPRTGPGLFLARSLSADDVAGVVAAYAGGNTAANRGSVAGVLTSGAPVFGGLVWVRDAGGVLSGHAITQPDGSFRIDGLPAGSYELLARPISDPGGFSLFAENNLGGFYAGLNRAFLPVQAVAVQVARAATTTQDLTAVSGTPPMDILLIGRSGWFTNRGALLRRGEVGITIGVAGPGLSASGAALSVSGPGVTVTQTLFGTVGGFPAVSIRVDVAADAPLGARDLVVNTGSGLTMALGGVEVLFPAAAGVPGEAVPLRLEQVGAAIDLTWNPAPGADTYRLFRGSVASLRGPGYDHDVITGACHISVTDTSLFADVGNGLDQYYLVTGVNLTGQGAAGTDSAGFARPTAAPPCP